MRSNIFALGLALPLALVAACDSGLTAVSFDVRGCPVAGGSCGLDNRLLIGGTTEVALGGIHASDDLSGVQLETDTPELVAIEPLTTGRAPVWKVTGLGAGRAHLIATDGDGEIQRVELDVGHVDTFDMHRFTLDDERVADRDGYDQVWTVRHDGFIDLSVIAQADTPTKGIIGGFVYEVEMDDVLRAHLGPHDSAGVIAGEIFGHSLEPGEHPLTLTAPDGSTLRLLIVAL
jgi:hypothetical protein